MTVEVGRQLALFLRDAGAYFWVRELGTSVKLLLGVAGVRGEAPFNFYKHAFRLYEDPLFEYQSLSRLR